MSDIDPWGSCLIVVVSWPAGWTPPGPFAEPDPGLAPVRRVLDFCGPAGRAAKIAAKFNGKQLEGARRFWACVRDLGGVEDGELDKLLEAEATSRTTRWKAGNGWWPPAGGAGE